MYTIHMFGLYIYIYHTRTQHNTTHTLAIIIVKVAQLCNYPLLTAAISWTVAKLSNFYTLHSQTGNEPRSAAVNIVFTDILLPLARMPGLKQNACCFTRSVLRLHSSTVIFMTWETPLLQSARSRNGVAWVARNPVLVYMYDSVYVQVVGKRFHTLPSHPTLGDPRGFSCGMVANYQTTLAMSRAQYAQ